jgi:hypothetical protein
MQDQAMQVWAAQLRSCRHWTQEQARDVLERQLASGLDLTAFAQRMGFVPQRLTWWRNRLSECQISLASARSSLVPVMVRTQQPEQAGRIVVELGDGVRIQINEADATTAEWVALLLSARGQS